MFFKKKKIIDNEILKKLKTKDIVKRYFYLVLGCFLLAFAFNVFFEPNNIVTGGITGIALIIQKLFGIPTSIFILTANVLLLIVSYLILGKEDTKYSIIGSILYPIFLYLTSNIAEYIQFNVDSMLLIILFGAIINGIASGLTFKYGFSTGGSDIICKIISKYFKISIGNSIKIFNSIVIISSGFFMANNGVIYDWTNVMYAIIVVYIVSLLNDKVLLGVSNSKSFYIITEHETAIKGFLINELKKGVTVLEARGGYTGDRKKVLMCVIPTKDYFLAKEGILEIDKDAIVLINDVYQSSGIE